MAAKSRVPYKPGDEAHSTGIGDFVEPGHTLGIECEVDGIATKYSQTQVYKMPDGTRAHVLSDGRVELFGMTATTANEADIWSRLTNRNAPYEYGWVGKKFFEAHGGVGEWQTLFDAAKLLK